MTQQSRSRVGLLIGVGSVGMRHLQTMESRYDEIVVVDHSQRALENALRLSSGKMSTFLALDPALDELADRYHVTTTVVSNWGTERLRTFRTLSTRGLRRIFLEKPAANSIVGLAEIASVTSEQGLKVAVGHQRRYIGIIEHLQNEAMLRCGGRATHVVVHGGAKCMVTQGLHWVDFAFGLFNAEAVSVQADLTQNAINPRGDALGYWAGSTTWRFPGDRFLSISYSNHCSVAESVFVYGPQGYSEVSDDLDVVTYVRNTDEINKDPRVTRTGLVGSDAAMRWSPQSKPSITTQLDRLDYGLDPVFGIDEAVKSTNATLAALIASQAGCKIQLPIDCDHELGSVEWNIS